MYAPLTTSFEKVVCNIPLRSYNMGELADLYQINKKTFRHWLKPIAHLVGKRQGHFYNVKQVVIIFEQLGLPGTYIAQKVKIDTDHPNLFAIAS